MNKAYKKDQWAMKCRIAWAAAALCLAVFIAWIALLQGIRSHFMAERGTSSAQASPMTNAAVDTAIASLTAPAGKSTLSQKAEATALKKLTAPSK